MNGRAMRRILGLLSVLGLSACATTPGVRGEAALESALRDMCHSEVALLGETGDHGSARTIEAKAWLVRRLVDECGFTALFFEGSSYDFLELERRRRRGDPAGRAELASAIGGLWNRAAEMQPLIDFLDQRWAAGRLRLGGIDDQLGSAGAFYSLAAMPAEFAALLPPDRGDPCRGELRRLIYGQVGAAPAERAPVLSCLAELRAALARHAPGEERAERLHLLDNIDRYAARIGSGDTDYVRGRGRSMWLNFRWLRGRLPRGSKIILWAATVHVARDARAFPMFAQGGNLGSYLAPAYGRRAFVLGFAAASGRYRSGGEERVIATRVGGSIEAAALAGADADVAYLGRSALRRIGRQPAGLFTHEPAVADWSRIVDGAIVFKEERAPTQIPR